MSFKIILFEYIKKELWISKVVMKIEQKIVSMHLKNLESLLIIKNKK